jgi:hypothetical protein
MVPEGLPRDRGKLLYEATDTSSHSIGSIHDVVPSDDGDDLEPTIEERARAKQERIQSLVGVMRTFFVLALVMTILPVMFIWYNDAVSEFWPMLLLIFMMIVIVFGIIMWISHMSKHPYMERIFENGFSAKDGFGGEIFVPWGIVRAYKEYDMEPDGEVLDEIAFDASKWDANKTGVMLYGNGKLTKLINSDVDNYPRIIGLIRTKVGHGEYETPSWEDTSRSTFLRASVMILAFSLFAGFLFALLVYFFDRRLVGDGTQALILTTLVISLIAFPITQYIITGWFWGLPKGIYPYVITLAMSSILIVSAIGFSTINDFSTY